MARPKRPNPHIESALYVMEDAGWRVSKSGPRAHAWGVALCAFEARGGCRASIASTPRNPQNHAKHLQRKVATCPHD